MDFIYKLILVSLVLTIIVIVFINMYIENEMNEYDKNAIDTGKLYKICKTGDLIYFRWPTPDIGFRLFSKFSHIGMVYKKSDDEVYILETHPEGDGSELGVDDGGVHIYNLKDRLNKYYGYCYLAKLNTPNKSASDITRHINENLDKYKMIPFDEGFRYTFIKSCFTKLDYPVEITTPMCCSQFIGFILKDLGVLHDHYNIFNFSPTSFVDLKYNNKLLYDDNILKIIKDEEENEQE